MINTKNSLLLFFLCIPAGVFSFAWIPPLIDGFDSRKNFIVTLEAEITHLKTERESLMSQEESYKKLSCERADMVQRLKDTASCAKTHADQLFIQKKLSLATQIYQTVQEQMSLVQSIIILVDAHKKLLEEYKKDPEFSGHQQRLERSFYAINEVQQMYGQVLDLEGRVQELEEGRKRNSLDLSHRQRTLGLAVQEFEEKSNQRKEFSRVVPPIKKEDKGTVLTAQQQGELFEYQELLSAIKQELAQLQVHESEIKRYFIESQLKMLDAQLALIRRGYVKMKQHVLVDSQERQRAQDTLEKKRQEYSSAAQAYELKRKALEVSLTTANEQITTYKDREQLTAEQLKSYQEYSAHPLTSTGWQQYVWLTFLTSDAADLKTKRDLLEVLLESHKIELQEQELDASLIFSWYALASHANDQRELLVRELKKYEKKTTEFQAQILRLQDKKLQTSNELAAQTKLIDAAKRMSSELRTNHTTLFRHNTSDLSSLLTRMQETRDHMQRRSETLTQMVEQYGVALQKSAVLLKKIEHMSGELREKSGLKGASRPLFKSIKEDVPAIGLFIKDFSQRLRVSVPHYTKLLKKNSYHYLTTPSDLFIFLLQFLILILLFLLVRAYLPDIRAFLSLIGPDHRFLYKISSFIIVLVSFMSRHLYGLFIWSSFFFFVRYEFIEDRFLEIFFYFISIPYLLVYLLLFLYTLFSTNRQRNYVFISKEYERRFFIICTLIFSSTLIFSFFREAFALSIYARGSDVPRMLLSVNFIIVQIALLLLFDKKRLLSWLPNHSPLWQWVYDQVDRYYALVFAGILTVIILSNPYLGYGPRFFYIVTRLILIAGIIVLLSSLHDRIKKMAGPVFFYTEGEVLKDRFAYGKTAYGTFIIISFVFFVLFALFLSAHLLGYPIGLNQVSDLLHKELYHAFDSSSGKRIGISVLDLLSVVKYIFFGLFAAFVLNRFILRRMFDLLLVNIGIQNALLSLTRYVILIIFLVVGLQSVGLSSALLYIFAIIGGIGVAGKDLVADFIGYFIILIQRPIKIGDQIRLDNEIAGVVRQITLRSVIIRRKNSVTLIVPNSYVMSRPLVNWNYSRTFFAFEDILLVAPYTADPARVRELLLEVLERNLDILKSPAPIVQLVDFVDSGFQFMIRGYLSHDKLADQSDIVSSIRLEFVRILRSNNIILGAPVRTVRVLPDLLEK